jgi:protein SCO1/2
MLRRLGLIFLLVGIPLLGIVVLGILGNHKFNTLPYFTEEGPIDSLVPGVLQIEDFELTNHLGQTYGTRDLHGSVWIAAFFATDADHVGVMTRQLLWPNFRYKDKDGISIVCFTLNPEHDTPSVLEDYINLNTRYNGVDGKWQFLTGEKVEIDRIIREEFKIKRDPKDPQNIATLWLVDSKGYLRGVYHAASEDALRDATEDIALLRKEMDIIAHAEKKRAEKFKRNPPMPLPILGPEGHTIPPFAFTSIDSIEVSHRDVAGKIKIVDYFFTNCPTICPLLSSQLSRTQSILSKKIVSNEDVMILSHSVDPRRDTPEKLSEYAEIIGADTSNWKFLTGNKDELYEQARFGYYLTAMQSDTAAGGFFHSDTFVLVDKLDRIRGYYDGTSTYEVDEMISHVIQLLAEEAYEKGDS